MWFLKCMTDDRLFYCVGKTRFQVGRTTPADLLLNTDASISRGHAVLILDSESNLQIQDNGSKYGTFVSDAILDKIKLEKDVAVKIKPGDTIRFGVQLNVWTAHNVSFITCFSSLNNEEVSEVQGYLNKFGGTAKHEWDSSCNFLTMSAMLLTVKVLQALVSCVYIVDLSYWKDCAAALETKQPFPNASKYTPKVTDTDLMQVNVSFIPDKKRKSLFSGKNFVFFSKKQMLLYKDVLIHSGAEVVLLSESKMTKKMLMAKNVIVIKWSEESSSQNTHTLAQMNNIVEALNQNNLRVVEKKEICLALLHCSTEKYCNPSFRFSLDVKTVEETQEVEDVKPIRPNIIIEESPCLSSSYTEQPNSSIKGNKRKACESEEEVNLSKKPCAEESKPCLSNSFKSSKEKNHSDASFQEDNVRSTCNKRSLQNSLSDENQPKRSKVDDCNESIFDFVQTNVPKRNERKFSFLKPSYKKAEPTAKADADDPFNFIVPSQPKEESTFFVSTCASNKTLTLESQTKIEQSFTSHFKSNISKDFDIKPSFWKSCCKSETVIKVESFGNDDFGAPVIVIKTDLIKRLDSTLNISDSTLRSGMRNFKKFKKVLPCHMQVIIMPRDSMSILRPTVSVNEEDGNEEQEMSAILESMDQCRVKGRKYVK